MKKDSKKTNSKISTVDFLSMLAGVVLRSGFPAKLTEFELYGDLVYSENFCSPDFSDAYRFDFYVADASRETSINIANDTTAFFINEGAWAVKLRRNATKGDSVFKRFTSFSDALAFFEECCCEARDIALSKSK